MEKEQEPVRTTHEIPYSSSPTQTHESRISIPFDIRLPAVTAGAAATGLALGLSHGSTTAGLRFRAENSHRFPTTSAGWYSYHRSKNHRVIVGGLKEGVIMGSKIAFWVGSFVVVEEAIDRWRGTKDFLSTVVAGLSISGGFSAWNRFPIPTAARMTKVGLIAGLSFGLLQDAVSLARGRHLQYVDFLLGRPRGDINFGEVNG